MESIPKDILNQFLENEVNHYCALCGSTPVQIHHNLIFGGRRIHDLWTLIGLCPKCHDIEKRRDIKDKLDWIMCNRATDQELMKYSKVVNWIKRRDYLNTIFNV